MARFVVERYLPEGDRTELEQLVTRIGEAALPCAVALIRTVIAAADHAVFSEYDADSAQAVRNANLEAALPFDRVIPVEIAEPV